jgi:hypothetical protein
MPHLSFSTLATGARQLVVQEALDDDGLASVGARGSRQTRTWACRLWQGADIITFLAPAARCFSAAGFVQEQAGGFDHDVGADLVPLAGARGSRSWVRRILLAVHDQACCLPPRHVTLEAAVHAVVLAACRPGSRARAGR